MTYNWRLVFANRLLLVLALGGCGRLGFSDQQQPSSSFIDEGPATFDQGTYEGSLGWHDDQLSLAGPPFDTSAPAVYTSRPFDTGDDTAVWTTLAWIPVGPYGRPLPDDGGIETGYRTNNADMTGNLLLLHLDSEAIANSTAVPDTSGGQHDGTMKFVGGGASPAPGVFGGGFDIARDAYVSMPGTDFDFGTGDVTFAIWVQMFDCTESNDNRIAMGGEGPSGTPHLWIGSACPEQCPGNDSANWIVSAKRGTTNEASISSCSGISLVQAGWHLLVGTKVGHSSATLHLYVDGREVGFTNHDYGTASFDYTSGEIRLGSFNLGDPQYNTRIVVDEASIWRRALSSDEVRALYQRGALHLELQVRACADGVCDTEPFVGPDGTDATFFSEADLAGEPGTEHDNLTALNLRGAIGQYRVRFATASEIASPGLLRVEMTAATSK